MPLCQPRWLGGMLTNFVTIKKRIALLDQLEARQAGGDFERLNQEGSCPSSSRRWTTSATHSRHPQDEAPARQWSS